MEIFDAAWHARPIARSLSSYCSDRDFELRLRSRQRKELHSGSVGYWKESDDRRVWNVEGLRDVCPFFEGSLR